ncbi:MAG TPA: FecR family protein [Chryseolinea sp.]|nr:FecR family protein [Chryseolinea sp.]
MEKEIEVNDELIAKYLTGEATPDEAIAVHDWLNVPANRLYFKKLQHAWTATFPSKRALYIDSDSAWRKIDKQRKDETQPVRRSVLFSKPSQILFRIAASIVLVLTFGLILYLNFRSEISSTVTISTTDSLKRISFPDRSIAVLNQNTTISYPETFNTTFREVRLSEGEAFFNIAYLDKTPFIIYTEVANIKVIGTAFNVVLGKNSLEVSVEEGKVLVFNAKDSLYLEPGNLAKLGTEQPFSNVNSSDPNTWAYATHKFVFKDTPLREVFNYVEKAQLCSIQIQNKDIGNCKLTATFDSVSTDYMLTLITEALNLTVTKNDNTFTVGGEGCQ